MKSEALEATHSWTETWIHVKCPYCRVSNRVDLGDLSDVTAMDIQACQCYKCDKKFWLPDSKQLHEAEVGFGFEDDPLTIEELGLDPNQDLIEHAYCEVGKP